MGNAVIGPPVDVPPERLFGILVDPCPSLALATRIADTALTVRAIPASEHAAARWAADAAPAEVRRARYARELLARCLYCSDGTKAFASADDIGLLDAAELRAIMTEAMRALSVCCPTYARSDWQEWQSTLEKGARHPENMSVAVALAGCADYGHGAVVWRPDRWYGVPMSNLLDGHWLCYRAARAAWVKEESGPRSIAQELQRAKMRRG